MKRVIRNGVYETNSSSCHTVSIRGKWKDNGYTVIGNIISVYMDEYGWNGDPCDSFISKLSYALCMVLMTEYPGFSHWDEYFEVNQEVLEGLDGYKLLLDAINNHGSCQKIVIKKRRSFYPYGYIDHQSCEHYKSLSDFLNDWNVDAERFLFDDDVVVWIGNDNG